MKELVAITLGIAIAVIATPARADEAPAQPPPRVFDTPNGRLQRHGEPWLGLGINHRAGAGGLLLVGLGDVAEVGLGLDQLVVARGGRMGVDDQVHAGYGIFRVGVDADVLAAGAPAIALGFRRTLAGQVHGVAPSGADTDVASLDLVMSKRLGRLDVHFGGRIWDLRLVDPAAAGTSAEVTRLGGVGSRLRPMAALAWTPALYPRTRLLLDLSSVPVLDDDGAKVALQGVWGVRYQAGSWFHIELLVRHLEGERLDGSTVFARVGVTPAAWWRP